MGAHRRTVRGPRIVAVLTAVMLLAGACSDGDSEVDAGSSEPGPDSGAVAGHYEASDETFSVVVVQDPERLRAGAQSTWRATVTNESGAEQALRWSSGLQVDVALLDGEADVWRASAGQAFTQAIIEETLAPGGSIEVGIGGVVEVTPGEYELVVEFPSSPPLPGIQATVTVA